MMNQDTADIRDVSRQSRASDHSAVSASDCDNECEIWLNSDGRLFGVNLALERLLGLTNQECLEIPEFPFPLLENRYKKKMRDAINRAVGNGGGMNDSVFRLRHKDGTFRYGSIFVSSIRDKAC
jgi:PAS domain S-box-containing protein